MPPPTDEELSRIREIPSLTPDGLLKAIEANNYYVSRAAARELAKRASASQEPQARTLRAAVVPRLREMLVSASTLEERWKKFFSLAALCLIADPSAIDVVESEGEAAIDLMVEELYTTPDDDALIEAVHAGYAEMVASVSPDPVSALIDKLRFRPQWVWKRLVTYGDRAQRPLIELATAGRRVGHRLSAIQCLGKIGGDRTLDVLFSIAYENIRPAAISEKLLLASIEAIGETRSETAVSRLAKLFGDCRLWTGRVRILDALGRIASAEALAFCQTVEHDALVSTLPKSKIDTVRSYAVLNAARITLAQAADKESCLLTLLKHEHPWARNFAAQELMTVGTERSLEALVAALRDESVDARRFAIQALARIGSTRAVDALLALLQDEHSPLRPEAKIALDQIGVRIVWTGANYDVCEANRVNLMFGSKDPAERQRAARLVMFLGEYGCKLLQEALSSSVAERRETAKLALDALADALVQCDSALRQSAARTFAGFEAGIPYLLSGLAHESVQVREASAEELTKSPLASDARLLEALRECDSPGVAAGLAKVLARRNPALLAPVLDISTKELPRFAAIAELSALEQVPDVFLPALVGAVVNGKFEVKRAAAAAIHKIQNWETKTAGEFMHLKTDDARLCAAALAILREENAREIRQRLPSCREPDTKRFVLESAIDAGGKAAVEVAILLCEDGELDVARRAAEALRRLTTPMLLDYLDLEENDRDELTRLLVGDDAARSSAAALALARLGEKSSCGEIVKCVNARSPKLPYLVGLERLACGETGAVDLIGSANPILRLEAARVLGTVAARRGAPHEVGKAAPTLQPLLPLLDDKVPEVRYWASWAVGQARWAGATDKLRALLEDPDPRVRSAARDALALIQGK